MRIVSFLALLPLLACGEDRGLPLEPRAEFGVAIASAPAGSSVWSAFGDATASRQDAAPDPWAVQLRSAASGAGFGGIAFSPPTPLTFAQVTTLSADFNVGDDDCGGGSPRFQVGLDTDGDGDRDGNIFVAFGPSPNFTGCIAGWQNTGNLIGNTEHGRYDASQVGGSGFGTYQDALAVARDAQVLGIQLVVDGSWLFADGEQTILVDNVQVNEHRLTARGFVR
ncbi:MAG: hypothetical protein ACREMN_03110 [Gemmatimonadales bacterium]